MNLFRILSNFFHNKDKPSPQNKLSIGSKGKKIACKSIKKNGYKIIEKNYRTKYGEIDIIAEQENTMCFIEVKARSSSDYGSPEEFVTKRKQKKLWRTSCIYINKNSIENKDFRFDVVAVDLKSEETIIFPNAFQPDY